MKRRRVHNGFWVELPDDLHLLMKESCRQNVRTMPQEARWIIQEHFNSRPIQTPEAASPADLAAAFKVFLSSPAARRFFIGKRAST